MWEKLIAAIKSKDEPGAKILIAQMNQNDLSKVDNEGYTALTRAARQGTDEVCKLLIPKMSELAISTVTQSGNTALIWAAYKGMREVCELLIPKMNDPAINATAHDGYTALTIAARNGHKDIVNIINAEKYFREGKNLFCSGKKEEAMKFYEKTLALDLSYSDKILRNIKKDDRESSIEQMTNSFSKKLVINAPDTSASEEDYSEIIDSMINPETIQNQDETIQDYVVPHFHGYSFHKEYFNNIERREYGISKKHIGKHLHSKLSYITSKIKSNKVLSSKEDDELIQLDKKIGANIWSLKDDEFYSAVQTYVNTYSKNPENFFSIVKESLKQEGILESTTSPLVSTSKTPEHAFRFSIAHIETDKTKVIEPSYSTSGVPKHRLAGVIFVTLHKLSAYNKECKQDITWTIQSQISGIHAHHRPQLEVVFMGGVTEGPIVAAIPVVYPNLSNAHLGKAQKSSFYKNLFKAFDNKSGPSHYKDSVITKGDHRGIIERMEEAYTKIAIQIAHKQAQGIGSRLVYVDSKGIVKFYPPNFESPWSDIKNQIKIDAICTTKMEEINANFLKYVNLDENPNLSYDMDDNILTIAIKADARRVAKLIIQNSSSPEQLLDEELYLALKFDTPKAFGVLKSLIRVENNNIANKDNKKSEVNKWWNDKILDGIDYEGVSHTCTGNQLDLETYIQKHIIFGTQQKHLIALNVHAVKKDFSANNHWVGLYIEKTTEGIYEVIYADAMGHEIDAGLRKQGLQNRGLENILRKLLKIEKIDQPILNKGIQYVVQLKDGIYTEDSNIDDCGPLTRYLLLSLLKDKDLQYIKKLDARDSKALGQKLRKLFESDKDFDVIYTKIYDILKYGGTKAAFDHKLKQAQEETRLKEAVKDKEITELKQKLEQAKQLLEQQNIAKSDAEAKAGSAIKLMQTATALLMETLDHKPSQDQLLSTNAHTLDLAGDVLNIDNS